MANLAQGSGHAYSYAQLEGLWIQAGGPRALAPLAAAIALAESQGDPGALNDQDNNGTQSSFGLWQISNGTHAPPAPNWADPHVNARLAVAKWKAAGDSFSPWGTFKSGAYKKYMQGSTTPQTVPATPGSSGSSGDPTCLMGWGGTQLAVLGLHVPVSAGVCIMRKTWARATLGGALMVAGGLVMLAGTIVIMARAGNGPAISALTAVPGGEGKALRYVAGVG